MGMREVSPAAPVLAAVASWPGVEVRTGERGQVSLMLGRRELGHLHGERVVHMGLPRSLWSALLEEGRIQRHPVDQPGWAELRLHSEEDVESVIGLLRENYDRIVARHGVPGGDPPAGATPRRQGAAASRRPISSA